MFEGVSLEARFNVVIERDVDGFYVASVPQLPGCHTQAKTIDELLRRIKDAIKLYLEVEGKSLERETKFLGVQIVEVPLSEA
jgi:predicted RNase H-like HicB family nuclease